MKRRNFIQKAGVASLGVCIAPLAACGDAPQQKKEAAKTIAKAFELPKLGFAYDALAPNIDTETMTIHHTKHHAGYVKKLNKALDSHPLKGQNLSQILSSIKDQDADIGVRNNGGGHYNHSLFWSILSPNGGKTPSEGLTKAISDSFTNMEGFNNQFKTAAATVFGSGWAWLSVGKDGKLFVSATPNQDNPMMSNIVEQTGTPILGIDVWEHAYYLNYQNRRKDYIQNFMEVVDWNVVSENYKKAMA